MERFLCSLSLLVSCVAKSAPSHSLSYVFPNRPSFFLLRTEGRRRRLAVCGGKRARKKKKKKAVAESYSLNSRQKSAPASRRERERGVGSRSQEEEEDGGGRKGGSLSFCKVFVLSLSLSMSAGAFTRELCVTFLAFCQSQNSTK